MRRLAKGYYIMLFYFTLEAATFAENQHVCVDRTLDIENSLPNYFTAARGDIGPSVYHAATSVFQHVHKSGGISVRVMLENVAKVYSKRNGMNVRKLYAAGITSRSPFRYPIAASYKFLHGDSVFGICDRGENAQSRAPPCGYWLLARDPYERLLSEYSYCTRGWEGEASWNKRLERWRQGFGDDLCAVAALRYFNRTGTAPSLVEWSKMRGNHMLNLLLDRPFGLHHLPNDHSSLAKLDANAEATRGTERDLNTTIENLERWFAVVGLTEHFALSWNMFREVFGIDVDVAVKHIHSTSRPGWPRVSDSDKSEILRFIHLDTRLYDAIVDLFYKQKTRFARR